MPVQTLTSLDPSQFFNPRSSSEAGGYRLDTRVSGVTLSNDFSGRFSVTTAEGDRITLTADLETKFQSASYASRRETDRAAGRLEAKSTDAAIERRWGIAVEGDLNQEEVRDLERLFQNIANIFRGFIQGQDEHARLQSANLAEGFGRLTTLSALDLGVEVVRSVTVVAASQLTPGGAPGTAAAIPQSSTGTTAPTPSSDSPDDTHFKAPTQDEPLASLIQQVLDALKEARIESDKVRKYLPDFLDKLHEDPVTAFLDERRAKPDGPSPSGAQGSGERESLPRSHNILVGYHTVTERSIALSIQV